MAGSNVTRFSTLLAPIAGENAPRDAGGQVLVSLDHLRVPSQPEQKPFEPCPLAHPQPDPEPVARPLLRTFVRILIGHPAGAWSEIEDNDGVFWSRRVRRRVARLGVGRRWDRHGGCELG